MKTPIWKPIHPELSNMQQFMLFLAQTHQQPIANYDALHTFSIQQPALFWQALCDYFKITFNTPPKQILNDYHTMLDARWFEGATFNFAEKLLSRSDDFPAIISLDEKGNRWEINYKELKNLVCQCAAGLTKHGVVAGDRVAAILPNTAFTVIAMLATASIGAIWSSCSSDFGVNAAVDRLGQISPKVLFMCDGHDYHGKTHNEWSKIKEISTLIPSLTQIVVCPVIHSELDLTSLPKTRHWDDFLITNATPSYLPMPFSHPLYILFSSGTTGKPKCIVHGAGGTLLQHIKELGLHTDIKASDNLFFYTTCGWMMWNWMVSTLALGATITLYEGSPNFPNINRLFQIIQDENVTVLGTSPKYLSTIEHANFKPITESPVPTLRCILSTGAPLLPEQYDYVYQNIGPNLQLSSISGGTDIVSCFALGNPILPVYRGELQCVGLGMNLAVFNEQGKPILEARGELVCTQPFPSMPVSFWNDPDKILYKKAYFSRFPNVWAHGDFAEITANHSLIIYGRSDAVLNPGGVRIGTAEIYRQVEKIPEIIDSVVIGQSWENDIRIVLFVVLRDELILDDSLRTVIRSTIRVHASPRHVPAKILQVPAIPRTISGKVVEIAVRQVVQGEPVNNVDSLANPEALKYFKNRQELCDC